MNKLRFIGPIWVLLIAAAFSAIVMLLWNWLMPAIFGLTAINIWQALGLFALGRILFGSFGPLSKARMMHGRMHKNQVFKEWIKMSPEQRREFIEKRRKFGFGRPHPFEMGEYDEEHGTGDK